MELNQTQQQIQTISPQMAQTLSVLRMGVQELREYVEEAVQENPVLELPEKEIQHPGPDERRQIEWVEADDRQNSYYHKQDRQDLSVDGLGGAAGYWDEEEELSHYLLSQFQGMVLEPEVMAAVEFLIERLDPSGFLDEDPADLAQLAGVSQAVMDRALIELRAADPAGVGAANVAECLLLQLERRSGGEPLARAIIQDHMDDLAHGRYGRMARALKADEEDIRAASAVIRSLNPRPATGFASRENLAYITPDVEVRSCPDHFELVGNSWLIPQLRLNDYYQTLLTETDDPQVKEYLETHLRAAKELMENIARRGTTLMQCAQWLVQKQEDFFRHGPGHLRPLTMQEAAQALDVHPSTISRTVRNKYFQCHWGVYPMAYLFSRGSAGGTSVDAVKTLLKRLVEEEEKPLSDQKLSEALAQQGHVVARRTVSKYREELGIPAASARKQKER